MKYETHFFHKIDEICKICHFKLSIFKLVVVQHRFLARVAINREHIEQYATPTASEPW